MRKGRTKSIQRLRNSGTRTFLLSPCFIDLAGDIGNSHDIERYAILANFMQLASYMMWAGSIRKFHDIDW